MKKNKLLFIFILVIICSGCTSKYTLTYENDKFSEELVISNITSDDEKALVKYVEGSEYLSIDENHSYHYKEKSKDKVYTYNIGEKFSISPLINTCFEDIYVLDEEDYIHIKTEGDYYCQNYEMEVYFETDKRVIYSNSDSVEDNVYKWDSIEDGIELQFSKTDLVNLDNDTTITKNANDVYIRLIICIVFVIIIIFTISHLKKKNNE